MLFQVAKICLSWTHKWSIDLTGILAVRLMSEIKLFIIKLSWSLILFENVLVGLDATWQQ